MSKMLIIKGCTECPNFIRCESPKDFTVKCKKIGNLGSPLNFLYMDYPCDCPLADAPQKDDTLDKIKAEIEAEMEKDYGYDIATTQGIRTGYLSTLSIIDKYRTTCNSSRPKV